MTENLNKNTPHKEAELVNSYAKSAADFVNAIREIARKPENLDNLESYLSYHFQSWLKQYASTPEGMVAEMKSFASMEI